MPYLNQYLKERAVALEEAKILDTPAEIEYDELTKLCTKIARIPIAAIIFQSEQRTFIKSVYGTKFSSRSIPSENNILQFADEMGEFIEVEDTLIEERFGSQLDQAKEYGIRYVAAFPIKVKHGIQIGSLVLISPNPNKLSECTINSITIIANQISILLEKRSQDAYMQSELRSFMRESIMDIKNGLKVKSSEAEQLLRAFKRTGAIIAYTRKGKIKYVNKKFAKLIHVERRDLKGKNIRELLPTRNNTLPFSTLESIIESSRHTAKRTIRIDKNGNPVHLNISLIKVFDEHENIKLIYEIASDATKEHFTEEELSRISQVAEDLKNTKNTFITNFSHEIRTPLNAIKGFTNVLLDNPNHDPNVRAELEAINTASNQLQDIITNIINVSKIDSGTLHLEALPFSLTELVSNLVEDVKTKIGSKELQIKLELDEHLPKLFKGDKERISLSLSHILDNAIKYTDSGLIRLSVSAKQLKGNIQRIKFSIQDEGVGIPEDKALVIFDRFKQGDNSLKRKEGGLGIGLYLTKGIIELMGGKIKLSSKDKLGTRVDIWIPLESMVVNPPLKHFSASVLYGKRILVCEDNTLNQKVMESVLRNNRMEYTICENGRIGIEALQSSEFDAILMDIQMPEMDGIAATEYIRNELGSDVPIIAVTANSIGIEREQCLNVGMNAYLDKPFKVKELLDTLFIEIHQHEVHSRTA